MDTLGFAFVAVGVVLFALVSRRLENTVITPPMDFTIFGLVIGGVLMMISGVATLLVDKEAEPR